MPARLQGRPDPVRIVVNNQQELSFAYGAPVVLRIAVKNVDEDQVPVRVWCGSPPRPP